MSAFLNVNLLLWTGALILFIQLIRFLLAFGPAIYHLRKVPAPKSHFYSGQLYQFRKPPESIFAFLRYCALKHYPIYKLGIWFMRVPALLSPEDYELVMTNQKHIKKGYIYTVLTRWLGTGLLTSEGDQWQIRRKILTSAFHFSILQGFLNVFSDETLVLVERLKTECDKPYTNVIPIISQSTLKIIAETSMGYKMNFESLAEKKYKQAIYDIADVYLYKLFTIWIFFDRLYQLSPTGLKESRLVKVLHSYTNNVIAKRQLYYEKIKNQPASYSERKRMAMLDLLLSVKDKEGIIDHEGIRQEVDTFMFEGHDTTAVSICFTLMMLANHRDIQEQILQEMEEVMGDVHKKPTYDDLQNFKNMERVIKESLRLYPSVPLISRVLGENMTTASGHFIPKGSEVLLNIYDTHHNPDLYPDPEKFNPDRFLPENCQTRHPFAYVPFSAGPRNCIGQRFAMFELKTVLTGIVANFVLEPVDTPSTLVLVVDIILRTKGSSVKVKFLPRTTKL